jgi:glycerol-3-phosphate acyltransferase PlsY
VILFCTCHEDVSLDSAQYDGCNEDDCLFAHKKTLHHRSVKLFARTLKNQCDGDHANELSVDSPADFEYSLLETIINNAGFMLSHILAGVIGYLFGSFPTAYFLVKWKSNLDIRKAGSGNVGTLNSYEVTNSKLVGVLVLVIDLVKGVLAVLFVKGVMGDEFATLAWGGIGAVLGHNFPVWLGFKGGRGLATAAGVMLVLGWMFVPIWMAVWFVGNKVFKDVNIGNACGTMAILLVGVFAPLSVLVKMIPDSAPVFDFKIFIVVLALVILSRLIQPVREYLSKENSPFASSSDSSRKK